jgi:hypothetical protein
MYGYRSNIGARVLVLVCVSLTIRFALGASPKLVFDTPIVNVGNVVEGQVVECMFRAVNQGTGQLEIRQVRPT